MHKQTQYIRNGLKRTIMRKYIKINIKSKQILSNNRRTGGGLHPPPPYVNISAILLDVSEAYVS